MNSALIMYLVAMVSCAVQQTSTSVPSGTYSEDLSVARPTFEVPIDTGMVQSPIDHKEKPYIEAKYTVNKPLDAVLDSIDRINLTRKYVDGFTIQLYAGLNREEALNIKKKLTLELPDLQSEMTYAQPNFKVKSGSYFTRMEAQKDFVAIKNVISNAIIIPDRIKIQ